MLFIGGAPLGGGCHSIWGGHPLEHVRADAALSAGRADAGCGPPAGCTSGVGAAGACDDAGLDAGRSLATDR